MATFPTQHSSQDDAGASPGADAPSAPSLDRRRLAGAALVVMLFFVFSRATGLLREIVIGDQFGTSAELDAYLAAFRVPDILFQLVAGGALGSAFIPTFASYLVQRDRAEAWRLFSRVLNWVTLVLVVAASVAAIFALPLVRWVIAPGFDPAQQQLTASLMRWMLLSSIIFGASGLAMGALNALQHFLLPALAPVLYNLSILLGAWLLAPQMGIYGVVAGAVGGALAHFLVQLPGLWRQRARYSLDFTLRDPGVREVARLMGPRVLGLLFVQMHFLVNTILASGLAEGSLSALNYAWLLMLLPLGIFAQAIGTVVFPTFAAQVAAGEQASLGDSFTQIARLVVFLTLPAALGLAALGVPLVRLLLEHGEFGADSTAMVAYALRFYALGLLGHAGVEIGVRVFYALHDTWTPVQIGIGAMALNILLSLLWVGWLSFGGLALANSVATLLEMGLLLWLLHRRLGGLDWTRLVHTVWRSAVAGAVMVAAIVGWLTWANGHLAPGFPLVWGTALGGMLLAVLVYGGVALLLGRGEVRTLRAALQRRDLT